MADVVGTAHIKIPDLTMTEYVSAASSTWTLNHNLNAIGMIIQFFDNNDEMMIPEDVHMTTPDICTVTWSEPVSGYALIDYIERVWTFDSIMNTIINGGYWKIGTGGSMSYKVVFNNDLETPVLSGSFLNTSEIGDYYYLDFTVPETTSSYNFTEIGIFNSDDNIMFYSVMSPLYKPSDMEMNIHYRIEKAL